MENILDKSPLNINGDAPFHFAAIKGHFDICEYIINQVADKNPKNYFNNTPLHFAAKGGHYDVFHLILNSADDKNPKNTVGVTPLYLAAQSHVRICELILAKIGPMNANPRDAEGKTPLHKAAATGKSVQFRLIFDIISNKNPKDNKGITPLDVACAESQTDIIKFITKELFLNFCKTVPHTFSKSAKFRKCFLTKENLSTTTYNTIFALANSIW